jgi:uncharacterized membrane protein
MIPVILSLFGVGLVALGVVTWFSHRDARVRPEVSGVEPPARAQPIPGLADIAGFVMAYRVGPVPVGRIAILGFWWWVGWHFFAR